MEDSMMHNGTTDHPNWCAREHDCAPDSLATIHRGWATQWPVRGVMVGLWLEQWDWYDGSTDMPVVSLRLIDGQESPCAELEPEDCDRLITALSALVERARYYRQDSVTERPDAPQAPVLTLVEPAR